MNELHYRLWGIEPERVDPHPGLTPAVATAVPRVTREILKAFGTGLKPGGRRWAASGSPC